MATKKWTTNEVKCTLEVTIKRDIIIQTRSSSGGLLGWLSSGLLGSWSSGSLGSLLGWLLGSLGGWSSGDLLWGS